MSQPEMTEGELLYGVIAISAFLGMSKRQAQHLVDKHRIPTWKEGRRVCARRQSLREWVAIREAQGHG